MPLGYGHREPRDAALAGDLPGQREAVFKINDERCRRIG